LVTSMTIGSMIQAYKTSTEIQSQCYRRWEVRWMTIGNMIQDWRTNREIGLAIWLNYKVTVIGILNIKQRNCVMRHVASVSAKKFYTAKQNVNILHVYVWAVFHNLQKTDVRYAGWKIIFLINDTWFFSFIIWTSWSPATM
jgi:hypothetical protein